MGIRTTLVLLFIAVSASAQKYSGFFGTVDVGVISGSGTELITRKNGGAPLKLDNAHAVIGIELQYRKDRLITLLETRVAVQGVHSIVHEQVAQSTVMCKGGIGWVIFRKGDLLMYPSVSAGLIHSTIGIYNETDPKGIEVATLSSPSFDLGFGVNYLISSYDTEREYRSSAVLGFKVGYMRSVAVDHWRYNYNDADRVISPHPFHGLHMTVSIAGFAFCKRMR